MPLSVLTLTYAVSFVDRQLLAILQESVKRDLLLSDSQLGLLSGTAFALFYVSFGIPIARLADRWVRRDVIVISIVAWSSMTAITGFARNFTHLLLARIGVAIGEAGCNPPSYSILTDLYPPHQRASAISFFNTGASWGMLVGFALGGWLEQTFGWRTAFLVVGLPGLLVGILIRVLVPEPPRTDALSTPPQSFRSGFKFLAARPIMLPMITGIAFAGIASYGSIIWTASFLIRVQEVSTMQAGFYLAVTLGLGAAVGQFGSGVLADRLALRDKRWYLFLPGCIGLLSVPLFALGFLGSSGFTAMAWLFIPLACNAAASGICLSLVNSIAPSSFRATASAIYFFIANGVGLGFGAWLIGWLSDQMVGELGNASLQYALLAVIPAASAVAAIFFFVAARHLPGELGTD